MSLLAELSHEAIAAYIAAGLALVGIVISLVGIAIARNAEKTSTRANGIAHTANDVAVSANETNKNIAKRQGVIELHEAWSKVNSIECNNLIGPDFKLAINALNLTATLWNHDVTEKLILFESYWQVYRELFDTIRHCNELVPGMGRRASSYITPAIERVYEEMRQMSLTSVAQTNL